MRLTMSTNNLCKVWWGDDHNLHTPIDAVNKAYL